MAADVADAVDKKVDTATAGWQNSSDITKSFLVVPGAVLKLLVDPLRLGKGTAEAIHEPNLTPLASALAVGSDVLRAAAIAGPVAGALGRAGSAVAPAGEAHSALNAWRLGRQLASESGSAEISAGGGRAIAGAGTNTPLRDAPRLVSEYSGRVGDWAKVTSETHKFADLTTVETHAYRNVATGQVVELKSKIGAWTP